MITQGDYEYQKELLIDYLDRAAAMNHIDGAPALDSKELVHPIETITAEQWWAEINDIETGIKKMQAAMSGDILPVRIIKP